MSQQPAVIVDAASSGKYLPSEFKKYNIPCIHVRTNYPEEMVESFRPFAEKEEFVDLIRQTPDFDELVSKVKAHNPFAVIPGSELGVGLADKLSDALDLPYKNALSLSKARRDKYEMQECLKRNGLDHIRETLTSDLDEAKKWVSEHGYPVFVKPKNGAGSVGNTICHDESDLVRAFKKLEKPLTALAGEDHGILVQECLEGQQSCINFVSWEGQHYLYDMWKYYRHPVEEAGYIFDQYRMTTFRKMEKSQEVFDYCRAVLDVTGLNYGPSHLEIIYIEDRGPVLVEINARTRGSWLESDIHEEALGYTQPGLTAFAYAQPHNFIKEYEGADFFEPQKYMTQSFLHFKTSGTIKGIKGQELYETLPSFKRNALKGYEEGKKVRKTIDETELMSCIYLINEDIEQLRKDANQLLDWQNDDKVGFIIE